MAKVQVIVCDRCTEVDKEEGGLRVISLVGPSFSDPETWTDLCVKCGLGLMEYLGGRKLQRAPKKVPE